MCGYLIFCSLHAEGVIYAFKEDIRGKNTHDTLKKIIMLTSICLRVSLTVRVKSVRCIRKEKRICIPGFHFSLLYSQKKT